MYETLPERWLQAHWHFKFIPEFVFQLEVFSDETRSGRHRKGQEGEGG
jgi:hypothetical protein